MLPGSFTEILNNHRVGKDEPVLLAISGGVDSVVLLHLASSYFRKLAVAHVNFTLRGKESDEDEQFVQMLSKKYNARFFLEKYDTKNYAGTKGISIQLAARELRYSWMNELVEHHGFSYLLTAHHLDDAFETTLYNLVKGTGISGLRGIKVVQGHILRPLLDTSREEIEQYATSSNLQWREDSSNRHSKYARNFLRNKVIPRLREINPSLTDTFRNTYQRLIDTEKIILREAGDRAARFLQKKGDDVFIDIQAFSDKNIAVTETLLSDYGCSFSQITDLLNCIERKGTSKLFFTESHVLNLDRDFLIVSPQMNDVPELHIDLRSGSYDHSLGTIRCVVEVGNEPILKDPFGASLDFDRLQEPLVIRKWAEGDRFVPLGMKGKKKISDFMIDEKIPLNLKERVCVLVSGNEIAWVIGHRISDKFKVTANTKTRFNISVDHDKSV